ncbi:glutamine amidotransferase [Collibacillus ludicampi]|uniref:Glutamine amidotransferase n=1 Tax=Collibacillus ludicampi TaxID=2771369 RepID=A0AAV4LKQ4_9BACL|nr:aminodeoxychorismate/anthranilate synthase component II [Collibacillus ludicampi]GIM48345.1 glutamine amidotransferase [Collibacillus ludicampi]
MIVVIDNYDSFTYNLVQYLREAEQEVAVFRNDQVTLEEMERLKPSHLLISPGPCTPNEAGISLAAIKHFAGYIPILGVCLGHQSIAQAFGGKVVKAERMMHGKTSLVFHQGEGLFAGLESPLTATRYHSLIVERESLPPCFEIIAETSEGEIMGIRHRQFEIIGVQFHPESILTQGGKQMIRNFLALKEAVEV